MGEVTLEDVGGHVVKIFQNAAFRDGVDLGWELLILGSPLQHTYQLNFFDEIQLSIKIFPHRNDVHDFLFRIEIYKSFRNEARGTRISCQEFPKSETLFSELDGFFSGLLKKLGI